MGTLWRSSFGVDILEYIGTGFFVFSLIRRVYRVSVAVVVVSGNISGSCSKK